MSWSLGEIGALATKAARGSGMDWGLADEAGYAVKWLQRRQLPVPPQPLHQLAAFPLPMQ